MDRFKMLVDWQEANETIRMSEKARLMDLSDEQFVEELDRMAEEYHRTRYGSIEKKNQNRRREDE